MMGSSDTTLYEKPDLEGAKGALQQFLDAPEPQDAAHAYSLCSLYSRELMAALKIAVSRSAPTPDLDSLKRLFKTGPASRYDEIWNDCVDYLDRIGRLRLGDDPTAMIEAWIAANGVTVTDIGQYQLSIKTEPDGRISYAVEQKSHRETDASVDEQGAATITTLPQPR